MTFDEFTSLCSCDIEKYRGYFFCMIDFNGQAIKHETIGFIFDVDNVEEMVRMFSPIALMAGTQEMVNKLQDKGYASVRFLWFQDDGYMVVLKTPLDSTRRA